MPEVTFDKIIRGNQAEKKVLNVPEWGGDLHIRQLSFREGLLLQQKIIDATGVAGSDIAESVTDMELMGDVWIEALLMCGCTSTGEPLFADKKKAREVLEKNHYPMVRIGPELIAYLFPEMFETVGEEGPKSVPPLSLVSESMNSSA